MKGSEIRKRYILLHSKKMTPVLANLEKELFSVFRSKSKFADKEYAIFLTNQFNKNKFIEFIRHGFPTVETVVTSGTIKKCKTIMESHRSAGLLKEKEISTLL